MIPSLHLPGLESPTSTFATPIPTPHFIMRSLIIFFALALSAVAQVFKPQNENSATQPEPQNDSITSAREKKPAGSIYGNDIPFIDPTQETVTLMGHTFNLGDNRLGGQFQTYLADSPNASKAALEYRQTIEAILSAVSPHTKGVSIPQKRRDGFALLPRAASYQGDGRICDSLSNAIYAAMLSKGSVEDSKQYITNLEIEKKRLVYNADITNNAKSLSAPSNKNGGNPKGGKSTESFEITEMRKRILEIDALKKIHQTKNEVNIVQAKIQYQAMLAQLFMQRRFEHVIIGTRFYNLIFRDGDAKMRLKKGSDVSKFFGEGLGVDPTVTGLDSAANEAIRKVSSMVAAFNNHLGHNEIHNASKRLAEAYVVGEFMPAVQTIPSADRRKILDYVREGNALVRTMDVRDYTRAKSLLASLKKRSSDFDSTKAEGAIAAFTRVSDGHIRAAQIALIKGDHAKFEEELNNATQVWPTNPRLKEIDQKLDRMLADSNVVKNLRNDFDRLLSEDNFREIHGRRFEFVPIVKDDPARKDAIEQIIHNITRIDGTIRLAEESSRNGNDFAAWEALDELRDEFPKDPALLQRLEKLSSKVADFTVALNRAREFEDNDLNPQTGSALSWYFEAKSIYPESKHAKTGIERLAMRIMPDGVDQATSDPAASPASGNRGEVD